MPAQRPPRQGRRDPARRAREQKWRDVHLPRIRNAQRTNSDQLDGNAPLLELLQHVANGVARLLVARPLAPLPWLADYLRRECKVAYQLEPPPEAQLVVEMHKKRLVIQHAVNDTKRDEAECKRAIRAVIALEAALELSPEELQLAPADHEFLATERRLTQADWSVDVAQIPLESVAASVEGDSAGAATHDGESAFQSHTAGSDRHEVHEWLEASCWRAGALRSDSDAYFDAVMASVTDALVELLLVLPLASESDGHSASASPFAAAALWLIAYLGASARTSGASASASPAAASAKLSLFLKTNYELLRTVDTLKRQQREMRARLDRLLSSLAQLELELRERERFVAKLSATRATPRTAVVMPGTPFELDAQRHWVPPDALLVPEALSAAELLGLRRAERELMQRDERRWRRLLRAQLEFDASTAIQRVRRGFVARRAFLSEMRARTRAARVLQRNYLHYLYHRAIRLPQWCRVGREVLVAPSVALKCAVSFQFYARKDFPTGNARRVEAATSVAELMAASREDEQCAGFSTDGTLKRFVPRQLSQLKPMAVAVAARSLVDPPGLFVKVLPARDDPAVVRSAIITAVPPDRFGLVEVAMDGLAISERVPVPKLSDRWRRVRVQRARDARKPRAVVFGRAARGQQSREQEVVRLDDSRDIECVVDEEEEDDDDGDASKLELAFQDQVTREVVVVADAVAARPPRAFEDATEREREIAARRRAFEAQRAAEYAAKRLASAVRLQCAWRSKRARDNLRQLLLLRVKEKEREQLVARARAEHGKSKGKNKHTGLFGRWRKGS